jgi:hypothetical protein
MDVTGTWKGEYAFEESEGGAGKAVAGNVVTFTMVLKQGWLGSVTGTVQDDPRAGFPEQGTIKGKVKGQVISFDKSMPLLRLIHEHGRLTLEQWAERRKVVMDTKIPHPKIRHLGDASADGNSFEGTWMVNEETVAVPGSYEKLVIPTLAGTWKMTRAG